MKLVYDWGINDANYTVAPRDSDGKHHICPTYWCWTNMIRRCHYPQSQTRRPTYVGCKIDERWRSFMAFRAWYLEHSPKPGEQLDKDYLGDGKLYSPETCCFVPGWLNVLFNDHGAACGDWSQGVYYRKDRGKFQAQITRKGKRVYLGLFNTPREASAAYLKAKAAYVEDLLAEFPQPPRIATAVRRKMTELIESESMSYLEHQS